MPPNKEPMIVFQKWLPRAMCSPFDHPYRPLYDVRSRPVSASRPNIRMPPLRYTEDSLREPLLDSWRDELETQESVRLLDVETFRANTGRLLALRCGWETNNHDATVSSLNDPTIRPVLYRYVDLIHDGIALLDAVHFELFMPNRKDLRFLGIPRSAIPSGTVEGDFFLVFSASFLNPKREFAVRLGCDYPVVWEASDFSRAEFSEEKREDKGIVEKKEEEEEDDEKLEDEDEEQEGEEEEDEIRVDEDEDEEQDGDEEVTWKVEDVLAYIINDTDESSGSRTAVAFTENDLVRLYPWLSDTALTAHSLVRVSIRTTTTAQLYAVEHRKDPPPLPARAADQRRVLAERANQYDPRDHYVQEISDVRTFSQRLNARHVYEVHALSETEQEWIDDRLFRFTTYEWENVEKMMELFVVGTRFRVCDSGEREAEDTIRVNDSILLRRLKEFVRKRRWEEEGARATLDAIYGREAVKEEEQKGMEERRRIELHPSSSLLLNEAQSRALRLYTDEDGPRVLCILSPPGSGKTTVAAAMAATVAHRQFSGGRKDMGLKQYENGDEVQLLMSVQNVAVDNMAAALKKMNHGGVSIYNMKSTSSVRKSAAHYQSSPFDFYPAMERKMMDILKKNPREDRGDLLTRLKNEYERRIAPKILLSTVEMMMHTYGWDNRLKKETMSRVKRVIIDEASLLTEAALFAIVLMFPKAKIVLIGDDHQLPPYMYDASILGHGLAGRPALSVAMVTGRVPKVELNEVYRAPSSIVAPYNRLAYGGRLTSDKPESEFPLTDFNLVPAGDPQLLFITVNGEPVRDEKTLSLYNVNEMRSLSRFLGNFPRNRIGDLMIICIYKEQQRRVRQMLGDKYTVLTVDSAQGKEAPIVIVLTTRGSTTSPFFCVAERCNVAVSRQQQALVILGNAALLSSNGPWSRVVNGDDFTWVEDNSKFTRIPFCDSHCTPC